MRASLRQESPLIVYPHLAQQLGLKEAIILQQVHYWLSPARNKKVIRGRRWVHNTYEQWKRQFPFWSTRTVERTVRELEKKGLLDSFTTRDFRKTKFYSINYDKLAQLSQVNGIRSCDNNQTNHGVISGYSLKTLASNCLYRLGQNGMNDHAREAAFYNTETTTENTLHPPLTPPSGELCRWQDEKDDLMKVMLDIWDETVYQILNPGKGLRLTKDRRVQMEKLLTGLLDGKIELWEEYCRHIADCSFLMGNNTRKFKVTLDWALNPKNALKVLENDFYSPPSTDTQPLKAKPWDEYEPVLRKELKHWPYRDEWLLICEALVRCLGQVTFATWFQQIRPKEVSSERVVLLSLNSFTRDYILNEFGAELTKCIKAVYPQSPIIEIEVDPGLILNEVNTPQTHSHS